MKKKWLCMYLTVVMLATTLSPADAMAEDFTDVSSDENGSVAEQELNGENVFDVTDESYVDAYENTEAGAGEETLISDGTTTEAQAVFDAIKQNDEMDPEFISNEVEENVESDLFADSAEILDMKLTGSGVYTIELTENATVRLIPETDGIFEVLGRVVDDSEGICMVVYPNIYNEHKVSLLSMGSKGYKLEKGKIYYLDGYCYGGICNIYVSPVNQKDSGICGADVTWRLENGIMTIHGSGEMYEYNYNDTKESNIHQFKQKGGEGICKGCDQSCKKGKSKNHGKIRKEKSDLYCNSKIILI